MKNITKKRNTRRISKKTKIYGKKRVSNRKTVNKRLRGVRVIVMEVLKK